MKMDIEEGVSYYLHTTLGDLTPINDEIYKVKCPDRLEQNKWQ